MKQDIGLMQQLKKNSPKFAEVVESMAINQEEVAESLPDSAAAQAVRDGEVNYAKALEKENSVASGFIAEEAEENQRENSPFVQEVPEPMNINVENVEVGAPPAAKVPPHVDAEIIIVCTRERIVPVEGNIGDLDDDEDLENDNDFEDEDNQDQGNQKNNENAQNAPEALAVPASTSVRNEKRTNPEFKNKEKSNSEEIDNDSEEEEKQVEKVKLAVAIKEAEEARIAEAARIEAANVEALEVTTMQSAIKADKAIIEAMYSSVGDISRMSRTIISNRENYFAAVAAGDGDERGLDKGFWISGTYGISKQGTQKGFIGYRGHTSGGTIGFDIGSDNDKDLVGIAYTRLDSKFKSNGGKLNTNVDSHIVALYGQKELPKNFMIQGMFA